MLRSVPFFFECLVLAKQGIPKSAEYELQALEFGICGYRWAKMWDVASRVWVLGWPHISPPIAKRLFSRIPQVYGDHSIGSGSKDVGAGRSICSLG